MRTEKTLRHQGTLESVDGMKHISATDKAGKFNYHHPREGDEAHRWRCLKRNMRHDERIDRDAGLRLLTACRKLVESVCKDRWPDFDQLQAEFDERFGQSQEVRDESDRYK